MGAPDARLDHGKRGANIPKYLSTQALRTNRFGRSFSPILWTDWVFQTFELTRAARQLNYFSTMRTFLVYIGSLRFLFLSLSSGRRGLRELRRTFWSCFLEVVVSDVGPVLLLKSSWFNLTLFCALFDLRQSPFGFSRRTNHSTVVVFTFARSRLQDVILVLTHQDWKKVTPSLFVCTSALVGR